MNSKNKIFDLVNVSLHNNSNDCWVIINARAYDVTNFLNDHPGGDKVLLDVAGKDASEEFEEAGHGSAARLMLDEYYIGEVDHVTPSKPTSDQPIKQSIMQDERKLESWFMVKPFAFFLSLAVFGVAIGLLLYK